MKGELIYTYDVDITGVADFGVGMAAILSGEAPVPGQGIRLDVAFEGPIVGRVTGTVRGVDYLVVRADGRMQLDIRATIETNDGARIALAADGVATMRAGEPMADLAENVTLTALAEGYTWVNTRQIWATGHVNLALGKIHVEGYLQ